MDLESTNGTFINGVRLESARYVLVFGEPRKPDLVLMYYELHQVLRT